VLWLVVPTVIGIGLVVLLLALNIFTASAFGDLQVTISGLSHDPSNPTEVTAGEIYSFTVIITNASGSENPAEAVVFEYRAPEVVVVHISSSVGWCEVGTPGDPSDPSTCSLGSMPSGRTDTVTIVVFTPPNLPSGTLLDHDVRAWQFGTEENPPNNEDHGWMGITTEADLSLSKTSVPSTVKAGELFQYNIEISNAGPSMAHDVVFTDTMGDWPRDAYAIYNIALNTPPFSALANCTVGAGDESVRCKIGDVLPGTTITGTINVYVEQDALQPFGNVSRTWHNSASVSSKTPDPDPELNTASASTTVVAEADLTIFKRDTGAPVAAGLATNYYFTVYNLGPSLAHCVSVTDTLPTGFTYLDGTDTCIGTADGFICNPAGPGCSDLAAGATAQFYVSVGIDPSVDPTDFTLVPESPIYLDTAVVGSNTPEPVPDLNPNTYVHATRVQDYADLMVRKLGRPDTTVVAGEMMTYTIQVDNLGPAYARNVVVTDTLDPDVTFVWASIVPTVSPPDPQTDEVDLVWELGTIPVPDPFDPNDPQVPGRVEIQVVVLVNRDINFPFDYITNRVEVRSTAQDPNPQNNITERFTAVTAESDMRITKTAVGQNVVDVPEPGLGPAPKTEIADKVTAGTFITYTLLITNAGPTDAVNVFVLDYVPPGIEPRGATITRGDGLPGECTLGGLLDGLVQCNIDTLGVYPVTTITSTATIVITGFVASSVPEGFYLNNNATVSSDYHDPDNTNDQTHNQTLANARADLVITKTARGDNVNGYDTVTNQFTKVQLDDNVTAGELLEYTLIVTNTGPSDAQNVTIFDDLPTAAGPVATVQLVSASGGAYCRQDPVDRDKITCQLGTMVVHEVRTVYILVRVDPSAAGPTNTAVITNTATVDSDTHDPVMANNTATNDTTVNARADIFVIKVDVPIETRLNQYFEPDEAIAGKEHRYLITFGNYGPSVARDVVVTDTLDLKQTDILGEMFLRCEPVDPDDQVTCSASGAPVTKTVTVSSFLAKNEVIISGGSGALDPGEYFSFYLITKVDPGYVLDADTTGTEPNLIAENTAFISSSTTDYRGGSCPAGPGCLVPANNQDTEQTEIIAEADLKVSKTDTPDPTFPPPDYNNYLEYDPVKNKWVYTYTLTIKNLGPSDAAKVVLYDWVPTDATFQLPPGATYRHVFTPTNDIQCIFRDDGLLLCLVGNDPNNEGELQRGRLNVSSVLSMTFAMEVDPSATPRTLTNRAWVVAVAEDEFPFALGDTSDDPIEPADFLDDRTPTADQYLTNNVYTETTTVLTGKVAVDKKAYVNRSEARDIDIPTDPIYGNLTPVQRCAALAKDNILVLPGDEIIYCYTITNPGETWLRSITLQDAPNGFEWSNLSNYGVIYPDLTTLREFVTLNPTTPAINQTITISTEHNAKAVLAPAGVSDDYLAIIITRTVRVDFPELGPISGVVWQDENGNGVLDLQYSPPPNAVEPEPLQAAGTTVALLNEAGQVVDTTVTDADGRYVFHRYSYYVVEPGRYKVRVQGGVTSEVFEYDPTRGYTTANYDTLEKRWYIESNLWYIDINNMFRVLGNNKAGVSAIPSTKYSTELPGVPAVYNSDLLHDTLGLPVLDETTKEWAVYEDDGDGLPGPGDIVEYTVTIPNTGAIEATGVVYYDGLYNYIEAYPGEPWVPATLINGSVSAAIHVYGRDPITGREIDAVVEPPDLAFGKDLLLRTQAPGIDLTYDSAIVLPEEILKGNNEGDDEILVATRLKIPPKGWLLRFDDATYDPPIPVTFSLQIKYRVQIKVSKYVPLGTVILNHGWVKYNEIGLFDQRFPDFEPADPAKYTAVNKVFNNHAGTPYRAWEDYDFPGWPPIPVDVEPTDYPGLRFDEYAEPGAALRDDDDPTWFVVKREPRRIQVPAIDNQDGWETLIQVQNAGDDNTGVVVFFWGEYSGRCSYSVPSLVDYACKWVAEDGVWSLQTQDIPSTARSAIIYSVDEDLLDQACWDAEDALDSSAAWRGWEDDYQGSGEAIAVVVERKGPNDHGTLVSSAYPGISENQEGSGPPYKYFAPYAMRHYHNLDTEIIIQNSGQRCTQIWLDYQKQGDDDFSYSQKISQLAPGESIRIRVPEVLGVEWLGSIYIESDEPLGIILDQTSLLPSYDMGTLLTYQARSYKLRMDTLFFADLVFREVSGWQASIQVQNLTQESRPTWVTVEFFDQSGDSILYVGDWVPRAGGKTFFLPAIVDLGINYPAGYVGAAVIESHAQVDYPGGYHDGQPIFVVVDLKKTKLYDEALPGWRHTIAGETQGGAYNAHAEDDVEEASPIMLPILAKDHQGVTSLIAIRNNSNCNNIGIKLEVRKGTGTTLTYVTTFSLQPGHIKLIDLANIGTVKPGFIGAGIVEVTSVEQLCDTNANGHIDPKPIMPSVVVVNRGTGPGDVTEVYEGLPWIDP
jgi:uncharacterized repeat protein (TIGR01451 family)